MVLKPDTDSCRNSDDSPVPIVDGPGDTSHNLQSNDPGFVSRAAFDFRLTSGSPAIDAGIDPGAGSGSRLTPVAQYVHPLAEQPRPRRGPIDLGAFEYVR